LNHFELVKANPQCSEIAAKPEFQKTQKLLADYIKELSS
jgi:hypothetical protein